MENRFYKVAFALMLIGGIVLFASFSGDKKSNATGQPQDPSIPLFNAKNLTMYQVKYDKHGHAEVNLPGIGPHEINQVIAISGKWIKVNFMGASEKYQGWINTDDASWLYGQW